jgi:DNA-directed RNA polymerase specialized sigma subunit
MVEDKSKKMTDEEAACTFRKMAESFYEQLEQDHKLRSECIQLYGELPFIKRVINELNPRNALELYWTINPDDDELAIGMMNLLSAVIEIMRD